MAEEKGTSSERSGEQRGEDQFERWAGQAGIKAPKLRHEVFADDLIGQLRRVPHVDLTVLGCDNLKAMVADVT